MKVILVQTALAHYRESLFENLCKESKIQFLIVSGLQYFTESIKKIDTNNKKINVFYQKNFYLFNSSIVWQSGLIKILFKEKPKILILSGVDLHNPTTLLVFLLSKVVGVKVFWWSHCTFGKQGYWGYLLRILFYKLADGILAYDSSGKERLIQKGVVANKITVIDNCLNESAYRDDIRKIPQNNINIVFSGRLTSIKKVDILIEAAQIIIKKGINLTVFIVGNGPEMSNLVKLSQEYQITQNIVFKGELYETELVDVLLKSHIGVIPSNAGLSLLQYMASGLPVITDDGKNDGYEHNPEISMLEVNKTGLIYKKNNPLSLAEKIIEIIPLIPYMSEQACQISKNKYHPSKIKENIVNALYTSN